MIRVLQKTSSFVQAKLKTVDIQLERSYTSIELDNKGDL